MSQAVGSPAPQMPTPPTRQRPGIRIQREGEREKRVVQRSLGSHQDEQYDAGSLAAPSFW